MKKIKTDQLKFLQQKFGKQYILDYPFPKPYCKDKSNIMAILLGCDPSNKHSKKLPFVFAIDSGLKIFNSFINEWQRSLNLIGLSFDNIYIQNLCRNYFNYETSENKIWNDVAEYWIPCLKKELNFIPNAIPVLLTSEKLYKVLINQTEYPERAIKFYKCKTHFIIKPEFNKLQRPLIPFYRHLKYRINNFPDYRDELKEYFKEI